jgi:xanthine dehydrogenase FAD-binding subunit
MTGREVLTPRSLDELWEVWAGRPEAAVYHGGTDVLVHLAEGRIDPAALICIERVDALKTVEDLGTSLLVGAGLTHQELADHPLVRNHWPLLARAAGGLASPAIRHAGTLGGNIGTASPAGDTLPALYCLDAKLRLISAAGTRTVAIEDFILGPGRTDAGPGELIAGVEAAKSGDFGVQHYEKVGRRRGMACAVASLAALIRLEPDGVVAEARFAWGSVGPTVVRSATVDRALVGGRLSIDALETAGRAARDAVAPIDDQRASADYRRRVAGNLLQRLSLYGVAP